MSTLDNFEEFLPGVCSLPGKYFDPEGCLSWSGFHVLSVMISFLMAVGDYVLRVWAALDYLCISTVPPKTGDWVVFSVTGQVYRALKCEPKRN